MLSKESLDFLKELVEAPSPSGFEQPAARVFREYVKPACALVTTDIMGNSIAVLNPEADLKVMLSAHIDQIGMIVKYVSDQGYLYFETIGGLYANVLTSAKVWVHGKNGPVVGVIGAKAAHQMEDEEKKQVPKIDKLWIDCGFKDKEEAEKSVAVGDHITLDLNLTFFAGNKFASPGIDNKTGVFIMAEALRRLASEKINVAVYGVATVQEELGLRGAKTAAYGINPQLGIALDVTLANDYPGISKEKWGGNVIGKGPVIDRSPNVNSVVFDIIKGAAEKAGIEYQVDSEGHAAWNDSNLMQVNKEGMATAMISLPVRYMHSPKEVASLDDVEKAIDLVVEFIKVLQSNTSFIPQ